MKIVVKSKQVCHLWANRAQPNAHNAGNTLSFDGDTLFSYRTPIARIVERVGHWNNVVLFSNAHYSITTSKHFGYARSAASHFSSFTVPALGLGTVGRHSESDDMHGENVGYLREQFLAEAQRIQRSTSDWSDDQILTDLRALSETMERYGIVFNVPVMLPDVDAAFATITTARNTPKRIAARAKKAAAYEARERQWHAMRIAQQEADKLTNAERLFKWRLNTIGGSHLVGRIDSEHGGAAIRISRNARCVETSHGVTDVPIERVREHLEHYLSLKQGDDFDSQFRGQMIGPYTFKSVTFEAMQIGCHIFWRAELLHLQALLNGEPENVRLPSEAA